MSENVYLDHNATTTIRPNVIEAIKEALIRGGNSSSIHSYGRAAHQIIEKARQSVSSLVGGDPDKVYFTSGGTEANNLALRGAGREHIFATAVEHVSVLSGADNVKEISTDNNGVVDIDCVEKLLKNCPDGALISIMLANNETGVIQPVAKVAEIARGRGALVHCDAIQAVGKIACNIKELGVDFLSLSAHKIGGPQGAGALVCRDGIKLKAINRGGGQERGVRSGTENLSGIAGFGAAAIDADQGLASYSSLSELRDFLEVQIKSITATQIFGSNVPRLPNTSCFTMPGVEAETQVIGLDLAGFAISSGSACSSGKVERSHVLAAMGIKDSEAKTAIRVSLGWDTKQVDIERFVDAWAGIFLRTAKVDCHRTSECG